MKIKVVRVILGMIGKLCISISFNTISIWGIELFPTVVRAQAVGFLTVSSRIGACSAPWFIIGLDALHMSAPYICMAVAALICAGMSLLLSETRGLPTLETEDDFNKGTTDSSVGRAGDCRFNNGPVEGHLLGDL